MKKTNVLITGGAGFFGSKLTEFFLNKGFNVTVFDKLMFGKSSVDLFLKKENFKLIVDDIQNTEKLEKIIEDNEIIFHMAALVGENICKSNKDIVYQINTESTKKIVDLCNKHNKKLVFFSTCSNYGKTNEIVNEDSVLNPLGLYSDSKIKSEQYIINNSKNYLIARCSTLLGVSHRMRYDLTLNQFMYEIFSKGKISVYGETAWRPYIHVEDACTIVGQLVENYETGIYNIGNKTLNFTKKQLIDILKTKLPPFEIEYVYWDDPRDYQVDFSKLDKTLNVNLKFDINHSIKELVNYFIDVDFSIDTKNNFNN